ncbi:CsgBAC operon transcriptional regulatory protein [Serratia entomophila]|uniref:helix-turn-helix transcriptional regulator n=1 Tax=Serratia entomophila TaxID=42906 RepID=UPI00217B2220|nr:LuxR family transcriptional regulator [Serratia entomophila]CAI0907885.1 CsgBAC operon transcriptional regulatory protein [Serratia entomophila]CAI0986716.1 CsgBAC operon transcriptional regulatory protein [Serratia entomophila]CAI1754273.1 CsgBAC operon transcriptional regulatory protein [Serratia entomophila]CAI1814750.1 CsgBAC operon transcriptional regulatory protein [Serratia entomophila]CAI1820118.1 CsgBAC operon transcriptional regulatory protein [Serratia entomophila]
MHTTASDAFINSCLATIAHLIPVSAGVFYLVDPDLRPDHYILHGISDQTHHQYLNHFQQIDPMKPANFHRQDTIMVAMSSAMIADNRRYYHDFMLPNDMRDITEIFIRQRKRIIAGVSLIRDTPFTEVERGRLRAVLPLIELATRDLLPGSEAQLLTAKEQEIVNMVREGASNKRIALKLGISLSTVKTHMRNIFAKTEVVNRTELVSSGFIAHG